MAASAASKPGWLPLLSLQALRVVRNRTFVAARRRGLLLLHELAMAGVRFRNCACVTVRAVHGVVS
jgi:hypothetical protein